MNHVMIKKKSGYHDSCEVFFKARRVIETNFIGKFDPIWLPSFRSKQFVPDPILKPFLYRYAVKNN